MWMDYVTQKVFHDTVLLYYANFGYNEKFKFLVNLINICFLDGTCKLEILKFYIYLFVCMFLSPLFPPLSRSDNWVGICGFLKDWRELFSFWGGLGTLRVQCTIFSSIIFSSGYSIQGSVVFKGLLLLLPVHHIW